MTQYIRLSPQEQIYGEKNLLQAQAGLLTIVQKIHNYKKLRTEELMLKILLKKKLGEAKEFLQQLDKLLPPNPIKKEKRPPMPKVQEVHEVVEHEKPRARTIDDEIEDIRRKIAALS